MKTIYREIVSALIFSNDNKILLGMKDLDSRGVYADCWHIPGGGLDEKEAKISALTREIKEETGIDISGYKIKLIDDKGKGESLKTIKDTGEKVLCKMTFFVYKVVIEDKKAEEIKIKAGDDIKTYKWVNIPELKSLKLTPPSTVLFKKLRYI